MNDLRNEFESHSAFAFEGFVKSSALVPQNKSDDLSSSKKMSACFQSICQRANAISDKLFYNSSQSLSCELAEKKGWEQLHECTIYKIYHTSHYCPHSYDGLIDRQ